MSLDRRTTNTGKREREARKRHRRAWMVTRRNHTMIANHGYFLRYPPGAEAVPLKLGRKHYLRWVKQSLAVADSRKTGGKHALEPARRTSPTF